MSLSFIKMCGGNTNPQQILSDPIIEIKNCYSTDNQSWFSSDIMQFYQSKPVRMEEICQQI